MFRLHRPALVVSFLGGVLGAQTPDKPDETPAPCDRFTTPASPSLAVDLRSSSAPAPYQRFAREHGAGWTVYHAPELGTPRFLAPPAGWRLLAAESAREPRALEDAVRAFVSVNEDLFGVGGSDLASWTTTPVGDETLVKARQAAGSGVNVSGAGVSALVAADGALLRIKCTLVPADMLSSLPGGDEALASFEIDAVMRSEGFEPLEHHLEVVVQERSTALSSSWFFLGFRSVVRTPGGPEEQVRDALTGDLLQRCPLRKHLSGRVTALGADLRDPNARARDHVNEPQPVPGIAIHSQHWADGSLHRILAHTDAAGEFHSTEDINADERLGTLVASLISASPSCPLRGDDSPRCCEVAITVEPLPGVVPCLPREFDQVEDCIPDLVRVQNPQLPFEFHFDVDPATEAGEIVSWLLQLHTQTRRVLGEASAMLHGQLGRDFRMPPAVLVALDDRRTGPVDYVPPSSVSPFGKICFQRYTTCFHPAVTPRVQVVPSIIGHELGHHIVQSITQVFSPSAVDEAAADVVGAYANSNPRIGFQGRSAGACGFVVGRPHQSVTPKRQRVGGAFWRLFELVDDKDRVRLLFYRWLASNRGFAFRDRTLDDDRPLLHELLAINRSSPGIDEAKIREAFMAWVDRPSGEFFIRGDTDLDAHLNLSDAIRTLDWLFRGRGMADHPCPDAMDADDDGSIGVTDPIRVLNYLFRAFPAPAAPFSACGGDTTPDTLGCYRPGCRG